MAKGYSSSADILTRTRDGQDLNKIWDDYQAALALFNVDGLPFDQLGAWLMANYRIVNTPIPHPEFNGIRITPNVYTTLDEIDTFADAVTRAIKAGIS